MTIKCIVSFFFFDLLRKVYVSDAVEVAIAIAIAMSNHNYIQTQWISAQQTLLRKFRKVEQFFGENNWEIENFDRNEEKSVKFEWKSQYLDQINRIWRKKLDSEKMTFRKKSETKNEKMREKMENKWFFHLQ